MDTTENTTPTPDRPLGYWLRVVDRRLSDEFARVLDAEDVDRRDWMLLNALAGDVRLPGFATRGKRVRRLIERGWVAEDGVTLTEDGRAAKERLGGLVDGIRSRVAGAVTPEEFATTTASLEAIARELGWDADEPDSWRGPRRFGRRGFGPGFGPRGFGPGFGRGFGFGPGDFGPRHGFGPDAEHGFDPRHAHGEPCGHGAHRHPHHRGGRRHAEDAYERGFAAGFTRGRDA